MIYALVVVLLCLTAVELFRLDYGQWKAKEQSLCQIKLDSTAEAMRIMKDLQDDSRASYDRHRQNKISFTTGYALRILHGRRIYRPAAV